MQNILVTIIESYIDRKLGLGHSHSQDDKKKFSSTSKSAHKTRRHHHGHRSSSDSDSSRRHSSSSQLPRIDSFDSIHVAKRRNDSMVSSASSTYSFSAIARGRTLFHSSSAERSPSPSPSSRRSIRRSSESSERMMPIEADIVRQRRPSDFSDAEVALASLPSLSSDEPWRATQCYNRYVALRA